MVADSGDGALLPRVGSTCGHGEWLQHLSGLRELDMLQLQGMELQSDDVACLADALGHVPALRLRETYLPIVVLPALVKPAALDRLELDLSRVTDLTRSALETALVALCRDAPALRRVACTNCLLTDCQGIQDTVLSWLHSSGKEGIELTVQGYRSRSEPARHSCRCCNCPAWHGRCTCCGNRYGTVGVPAPCKLSCFQLLAFYWYLVSLHAITVAGPWLSASYVHVP